MRPREARGFAPYSTDPEQWGDEWDAEEEEDTGDDDRPDLFAIPHASQG